MKFYILASLLCSWISIQAAATYFPEDQIRPIKELPTGASNVTKEDVDKITAQMTEVYSPIAKQFQATLNIQNDWSNKQLYAGSQQSMNLWMVKISGALSQRPELTADGIALILCHELGHHFGGYPFFASPNPFIPRWAAVEGEADYYSTQVCAKKIWANEADKNALSRTQVPAVAKRSCDMAYEKQTDRDLCYRVNVGVMSIMTTMAVILKKPVPQYETPDTNVVTQTMEKWPAVQCRLDTVFQASLCSSAHDDHVIPGKTVSHGMDSTEAVAEAAANSCMKASGFAAGLRPACWFKEH